MHCVKDETPVHQAGREDVLYQWLSTHVDQGVQRQLPSSAMPHLHRAAIFPSLCPPPVQVGIVEENHTPILGLDVWEHVRCFLIMC